MKPPPSEALLDTTVLIDTLRGRPAALRALGALLESGYELTTTAINIAEVYAGMRPDEEVRTTSFLAQLKVYSITPELARSAGLLKSVAARKGRTLGLDDMLIAATALQHDLLFLTSNRRDFPIHGLRFHAAP